MSKTTSIYTRVEPELKNQVELVLSKLGIPMANAINLFLHQIVLQNGIPFEIKLPENRVSDFSALSKEEFDTEIKKGVASMESGRITSSEQIREGMQKYINNEMENKLHR